MLIKGTQLAITGLLAFAAGAVVGLLYAPASGERTRRRLVRSGEALGERAVEALESVAEVVERGRSLIA